MRQQRVQKTRQKSSAGRVSEYETASDAERRDRAATARRRADKASKRAARFLVFLEQCEVEA